MTTYIRTRKKQRRKYTSSPNKILFEQIHTARVRKLEENSIKIQLDAENDRKVGEEIKMLAKDDEYVRRI